MKRTGDIASLFHRYALKIGKKTPPDVAEGQTKELVCMLIVVEEQTQKPTNIVCFNFSRYVLCGILLCKIET